MCSKDGFKSPDDPFTVYYKLKPPKKSLIKNRYEAPLIILKLLLIYFFCTTAVPSVMILMFILKVQVKSLLLA